MGPLTKHAGSTSPTCRGYGACPSSISHSRCTKHKPDRTRERRLSEILPVVRPPIQRSVLASCVVQPVLVRKSTTPDGVEGGEQIVEIGPRVVKADARAYRARDRGTHMRTDL